MENRVWIYTSEKKLSEEQKNIISQELTEFLKNWNAHGLQLSASFEILYDHLIVIKADEATFTASGCSIDKQVHFMKSLGQRLGLDFFNRLLAAFMKNNEFTIVHSSKIPELLQANILNENSPVFDLGISSEKDLNNSFQVPIKQTWLKKYLTVRS